MAPDLHLPNPPRRLFSRGDLLVAPWDEVTFVRLEGQPEVARDLLQRLCASDLRPLAVGETPGSAHLLLDRDGTLVDRAGIRLDHAGALIAPTPERLQTVQDRIEGMIFLEPLRVVRETLASCWSALGDLAGLPGIDFRLAPGLALGRGPLPDGLEPVTQAPAARWVRALLDRGELPLWLPGLALNPLYTGLAPLIGFTKGCYPGQEVIARMDSRGRIGWRLVCPSLPALPDGIDSGEPAGPGVLQGQPEPGEARLLGVLPAEADLPARVLCLVRPQWTRLDCRIGGRPHAIPLG